MSWFRRDVDTTPHLDSVELVAHRAAIALLTRAIGEMSAGNLEARVPEPPGPAELQGLRSGINHALDVMDAFVRESGASLTAAAEGRYHRQFLVRGMPGSFLEGATLINEARRSMQTATHKLAEQDKPRDQIVDKATEASIHVAAAATELGASAAALAASARSSVAEADAALETVHALERSSLAIQTAVTLIKQVSAQTRLLALNATAAGGDQGLSRHAEELRSEIGWFSLDR